MCLKFNNCTYFEIGTWRGESVINLTEVADDINTLDLGVDEFSQFNLSKNYANAHGYFINNHLKIKQHFGDSSKFDFAGLNKKFDVIFIDGNHHYDYVLSDSKNVFDELIHDKSIVIWHDYGFSPENIRYEILNAIINSVPKQFHKNLYHVENTMCAIYIPENIESTLLEEYANPKRTFSVEIKIN